jgi:hypothetical protein
MTSIDPWFLYQLKEIAAMETELVKLSPDSLTQEILQKAGQLGIEITPTEAEQLNHSPQLTKEKLRQAKRLGISDERIALSIKTGVQTVRRMRETLGILPVYKLVDTCAVEFESYTPYFYSTYEEEDEAPPTDKKKILILGSGPTALARASSLITAAATRPSRCMTMVMKPSWSTAILKRFLPITTRVTAFTLSRSPLKMCSRFTSMRRVATLRSA